MRVFKRLLLILWCVIPFAGLRGAEIQWEALPKGRPFRLPLADPREIRMGLSLAGSDSIQAAVGNYFSLVSLRTGEGDLWHLGIEGAGYFGMRQAGGRFPLETTDGLIGLYLDGNRGDYQWQLRYSHISSHLADGSTDTAIPFSREYVKLRGSWVPSPFAQVYVGTTWIVNTVPDVGKWGLQWGASYFMPTSFQMVLPFIAADFQWKQESIFNPSLSFQLGVALNDPPEAYRSFRIYYAYQTGADYRGQFYDRPLTLHSLGIEMQI